jgi:GDPmannose 4,6-dehydratase
MTRALIFGITGQDGSYLAELLLSEGYEVFGVRRRSSSFNSSRIDHLISDEFENQESNFHLVHGDLLDPSSLIRILLDVKPDEIYNLAGQSHVAVSFETPDYTSQTIGLGVLRILEAIRLYKSSNPGANPRYYQASSSEMFGNSGTNSQNEKTPMVPVSPYAISKLYGYQTTILYREAFGIHASNGILFNHESPRRGETFVTRKITRGISEIIHGQRKQIHLGNLNAQRDWGHAKDYVRAMRLIVQQNEPQDFVVATGVSTSVRDFTRFAFRAAGIDLEFQGSGENEIGFNTENGHEVVVVNPSYYRPVELEYLCGNYEKARSTLGWSPQITLEQLISEMVESDLKLYKGSS